MKIKHNIKVGYDVDGIAVHIDFRPVNLTREEAKELLLDLSNAIIERDFDLIRLKELPDVTDEYDPEEDSLRTAAMKYSKKHDCLYKEARDKIRQHFSKLRELGIW